MHIFFILQLICNISYHQRLSEINHQKTSISEYNLSHFTEKIKGTSTNLFKDLRCARNKKM